MRGEFSLHGLSRSLPLRRGLQAQRLFSMDALQLDRHPVPPKLIPPKLPNDRQLVTTFHHSLLSSFAPTKLCPVSDGGSLQLTWRETLLGRSSHQTLEELAVVGYFSPPARRKDFAEKAATRGSLPSMLNPALISLPQPTKFWNSAMLPICVCV